MTSHTSVEVKGWSIGLVTAIVDGESQSSKEVMNFVQKDLLLGYSSCCSNENGAVIVPLNIDIQHTPAVIPEYQELQSNLNLGCSCLSNAT